MFAAGGTGGHVYPALAIAHALKSLEPSVSITFAGTRERMEWDVVPRAGFPICPISAMGLQRNLAPRNVLFPFKLVEGIIQSLRLIEGLETDVVIGTGGFVAGPVLLAARMKGRPIVIQEQNAYAGLTNRVLARWATRIHIAFAEAEGDFPPGKCMLTGNPTRPELSVADRKSGRMFYDVPHDANVLFVFGGSLGSLALNAALEDQLADLLVDEKRIIIWQTGARYFERIQAGISLHPRLRLVKYVNRMDMAYAAADLVLSRAGAITCSELMVTGTPAVLVPSPNVAEDHQTKNARSMQEAGAAVLLPELDLKSGLIREVNALANDAGRRKEMAAAARRLARPNAAVDIANSVLALVEKDRLTTLGEA